MAPETPQADPGTSAGPYPDVAQRADYPALEERILRHWADEGAFEASIEARPGGDNEFVFYDGPPFANGLPHYGHVLTGYVKDVIPRYQTMRGRRVERRFGWDCHGLPAEMNSEKELGISGRAAIEEFGIENFNNHCRSSVLQFTSDWEEYVTRQARWVDFENDYKTMDTNFMESVMWAFSELWRKGLIYEDFRVMPYSWGAETPLSNFEIRLDDATRPRQDPAVTVSFELHRDDNNAENGTTRYLLAWTTTPWTLPSNLALAVGPDITYAVMALNGSEYVLAEAALEKYAPQLEGAEQVGTVAGAELVGSSYTSLFDYFSDAENAFHVLAGDFIDTEEGTGVVHMAPGFGEDDQRVCAANGISVVVPVDDAGRFTSEVPDWEGINVFEANPEVIKTLKERGRIVRHDTYDHNYPHCWRTDTPIIYRAVSSWYVRVTDIQDRMIELNQSINWIPDHVRDGAFGKWLEGARDWSISRNRYWGSPIPVWRSDNPEYPRIDVYGSLDELEADFGVRPKDLHRPEIDNLVRPNPDDPSGESMMRRVPEVLDCWFESGSMPYAQVHYPFENSEWFDTHNPADFIVEYMAQTRGWFYTMHVLATALFDRPAFSNVICHGVLLDGEGRKFSKRLKNYRDPKEIFATYGSDAFRWYLVSSPILRGLDLRVDADGSGIAEVVRLVLNPIWNAYRFFTSYANVDDRRAKPRADSTALLDRYLLAKTRTLVDGVMARLDAYDLAGACTEIDSFVDALNNWYIRRSRSRFWTADDAAPAEVADKHDAYDTLALVLQTLAQVSAPLLPFLADEIHRGLTGTSVHLADYPDPETFPADPDLVADMDRVRQICSAALMLREENGIKVRTPLATLTVAGPDSDGLVALAHLITAEINVKEVAFTDDVSPFGTFVLKPLGKVLGPRLGGEVQNVIKAAKAGDWTRTDDGGIEVAGHRLGDDEYEMVLQTDSGSEAAEADGAAGHASASVGTDDTVVDLDLVVTPELAAEGLARDMVRHIQEGRKAADLHVADRIALRIAVDDTAESSVASALTTHQDWIAEQVLARTVDMVGPDANSGVPNEVPLGSASVRFGFDVIDA